MKDIYVQRIIKAIKYCDKYSRECFKQDEDEIKKGIRKNPCGCFGAHMARCFRIDTHSIGNYWNYESFMRAFIDRKFFGINVEDLRPFTTHQNPFDVHRWIVHPAEALRKILKEKTGIEVPK